MAVTLTAPEAFRFTFEASPQRHLDAARLLEPDVTGDGPDVLPGVLTRLMRDIGIPHDKINVNGGGTALGHPIGASGTRIIVTLLNALKQQGKKRGVASLCIGGGEATAVAVEMV
jgi:acetyl-CoA acetyltransferase